MIRAPEDKAVAVEIARQANAHIRAMAEELDSVAGDERAVGFFCECGCLEIVDMTVATYKERSGAWIAGHLPTDLM